MPDQIFLQYGCFRHMLSESLWKEPIPDPLLPQATSGSLFGGGVPVLFKSKAAISLRLTLSLPWRVLKADHFRIDAGKSRSNLFRRITS